MHALSGNRNSSKGACYFFAETLRGLSISSLSFFLNAWGPSHSCASPSPEPLGYLLLIFIQLFCFSREAVIKFLRLTYYKGFTQKQGLRTRTWGLRIRTRSEQGHGGLEIGTRSKEQHPELQDVYIH